MDEDPLRAAVDETLARHGEQARRWAQNQRGAWGFLAGQGILAYKRRLGRPLSEGERRNLWANLWQTLEAQRAKFS